MQLLKFVILIPAVIGSIYMENRKIREIKLKEDMSLCNYVLTKLPKLQNNTPIIPYKKLYKNETQTTMHYLSTKTYYCLDNLTAIIIDVIVYLFVFIWFLYTLRYPMP